jgi:hypothetical protein
MIMFLDYLHLCDLYGGNDAIWQTTIEFHPSFDYGDKCVAKINTSLPWKSID